MSLLLEPWNDILGSASKVRLLRTFARSGVELSVREAARLASISHVSALQALDTLALAGVLNRKILGRQHAYQLNPDNVLVPLIRRLFEMETQRFNDLLAAIRLILSEGKQPDPVGVYVIGSGARGEDRPGSDTDILMLTRNQKEADQLHSKLAEQVIILRSKFGVALSPIVLPQEVFRQMYFQQESFALNAVNDARLVAGENLERIVRDAPRSHKKG